MRQGPLSKSSPVRTFTTHSETYLARPIGMQDFDRARQKKVDNKPESVHPEYAMFLSTRDMARLGLLMLRKGVWNGKAILKRGWTDAITTMVTPPAEIHPLELSLTSRFTGRWGYGMLWWVWDAPVNTGVITGPYQGAYEAMGAGGQYIVVLPAADAVVVHKVDIDSDDS
jgi:CubicO group peptidase (beta-lactamase class C family)